MPTKKNRVESSGTTSAVRQRLDDHDTGHHRTVREVPRKERLIGGDVLDGLDALALDALQHAIDQQEWITVRQQAPDVHVVE
jgi:hypothetical protein